MKIGEKINTDLLLGYDYIINETCIIKKIKLINIYNVIGLDIPVFTTEERLIHDNKGICIQDINPIISEYRKIILLNESLFLEDKTYIDYIIFHELGHIVLNKILSADFEPLFFEDDVLETFCDIYAIDILNLNNDDINSIINKMINYFSNSEIINIRMRRLRRYMENRIGLQPYIQNIFNHIIEDMQYMASKERIDKFNIYSISQGEPVKDLFKKI